MNYKQYVISSLLLILCYNINAQSKTQDEMPSLPIENKHSLYAEFGGRTFVFGSVNYEYKLNQNVSLGGGLGVISLQTGEIIRNNNGISETGNYFDASSTQMLYGNYFIGKKKHQLYFTGGVTHFLFNNVNKYPSETQRHGESQLEWNAGVGYQYAAKRMNLRLTGYLISMPEPSGWFPKYMPWAGLSMGFKLNKRDKE